MSHPKLLFLDFDGVIRLGDEDGKNPKFNPRCFDRVLHIVAATGCKIVVTSDYGREIGLGKVQEEMARDAGSSRAALFRTLLHPECWCLLNFYRSGDQRPGMIHDFLTSYPADSYCIIDDQARLFDNGIGDALKDNLVITSNRHGISDSDAARVIELLGPAELVKDGVHVADASGLMDRCGPAFSTDRFGDALVVVKGSLPRQPVLCGLRLDDGTYTFSDPDGMDKNRNIPIRAGDKLEVRRKPCAPKWMSLRAGDIVEPGDEHFREGMWGVDSSFVGRRVLVSDVGFWRRNAGGIPQEGPGLIESCPDKPHVYEAEVMALPETESLKYNGDDNLHPLDCLNLIAAAQWIEMMSRDYSVPTKVSFPLRDMSHDILSAFQGRELLDQPSSAEVLIRCRKWMSQQEGCPSTLIELVDKAIRRDFRNALLPRK